MRFPFFKLKKFEPDFPIMPLYCTEQEAQALLSRHASVAEEEPESDRAIAQKLLAEEIGPRMLARIARRTGLRPEDF